MFDLNIESKVEQLFKLAIRDYPNNQWLLNAVYWSDGDCRISLQTSFSGKIRRYTYRKSDNTYRKTLTKIDSALVEEILEDEEISTSQDYASNIVDQEKEK